MQSGQVESGGSIYFRFMCVTGIWVLVTESRGGVCVCARGWQRFGDPVYLLEHIWQKSHFMETCQAQSLYNLEQDRDVHLHSTLCWGPTSTVRHEKEMNIAQTEKENQKQALFTATVSSAQKASREQRSSQNTNQRALPSFWIPGSTSELAVCF